MKKLLSILTIAAMLLSNAALGYADSQGTVTITIGIQHTVNIAVGGNTGGLTVIPGGDPALSSGAITVENDGTGVNETVTLAVTDQAGWTLEFQFNETQPMTPEDPNWKTAGNISEVISYGETKNLWVKITPPAATAETSLNITVTVSAVQTP